MARPRAFDPNEALSALKDVFWRKGFEGASLAEIEAATGLNKQSLYRIFPDKRAMYLAALRDYEGTEVAAALELLRAPGSAHERIGRVFAEIVEQAKSGDLRGCFFCNASVEEAQLDAAAKDYLRAAVARLEASFAAALAFSSPYDRDKRAQKRRATSVLAGYFGLRVLVKAGQPPAKIKQAAADIISAI